MRGPTARGELCTPRTIARAAVARRTVARPGSHRRMRPGAQVAKLATTARGSPHKQRTGKGARMLARCMIATVVVWTGCSFEGAEPDNATVTVQGQVVDFQTATAVDATTDVAVSGLIPP